MEHRNPESQNLASGSDALTTDHRTHEGLVADHLDEHLLDLASQVLPVLFGHHRRVYAPRSLPRSTLPRCVRGSASTNTTSRGYLYGSRFLRAKSFNSSSSPARDALATT